GDLVTAARNLAYQVGCGFGGAKADEKCPPGSMSLEKIQGSPSALDQPVFEPIPGLLTDPGTERGRMVIVFEGDGQHVSSKRCGAGGRVDRLLGSAGRLRITCQRNPGTAAESVVHECKHGGLALAALGG